MALKIIIARLNHETNTFSPIATPLSAFEPKYGAAARQDQQGARTAMGAYLALTQSLPDALIVTPLSAMANPSGTVDGAAYDTMCDAILSAVAGGCDAIMLDLHGAMVSQHQDDGEGALLEKIRRLAPDVPLCVALDLHGNLTQKMMDHCDIIVGFKTYPHIDMFETGAHAGRLLLSLLARRSKPVMGWRQLPLLSHTLMSNTACSAMQHAEQAALAAEALPGVLAVTVMAGFALADFADAGMSVVVVTEQDAALADTVAQQIAQQLWQQRAGFTYASEPLSDSLARARQLAAGAGRAPVLLLDHSDNVMSGGSCDTMDVLAAALRCKMSGIAMGPLCDPVAVATLIDAGLGATVTLTLGNKTNLTAQGLDKTPLLLSGVVRAINDGCFRVSGPIYTGSVINMGRTVLFDIGAARIVVTEQRTEPYDLGVFACVGLDPAQADFVLLKSRMYCRPVYVPLSRAVVECDSDSGGPTSSDYAFFPFQKMRRPIYPLDDDFQYCA
ncbi:MAG: microcystin degradation protein MlrC [Janthinobacterium sp.]|jgi:microcystin degradation protein MlrC